MREAKAWGGRGKENSLGNMGPKNVKVVSASFSGGGGALTFFFEGRKNALLRSIPSVNCEA